MGGAQRLFKINKWISIPKCVSIIFLALLLWKITGNLCYGTHTRIEY